MSPGLKRFSVSLLGIVLPLLLAGRAHAQVNITAGVTINAPSGATTPPNTCTGSSGGQLSFKFNIPAGTSESCASTSNGLTLVNFSLFSTSSASESVTCPYSLDVAFTDVPTGDTIHLTYSGTLSGTFSTGGQNVTNTFDAGTLALNGTTMQVGCTTITFGAPSFLPAAKQSGAVPPQGALGGFFIPITCVCTPLTCNAHANITAPCATSTAGAVVTYTAPTVSVPGHPNASVCLTGGSLTCSPASGSTFPIGTTTVNCTGTDLCGNAITCSFTVTVPPLLTASCAVTTAIKCNGGTGTVTVSATGGTPPYTGTGTFTESAGTTSFTVTDANGCTATTSCTLTQPPALVASCAVTTAIKCNGGTGTVTVSATGGTPPYTGTGTFTESAGTTSFTVTDANGCTATTSCTLTQPPALTITASAAPCSGGSSVVTVTVGGGTPPYTVSDGTSPQSGSGTTFTFTETGGATVTFTVTDANGCTASTSVTTPSCAVGCTFTWGYYKNHLSVVQKLLGGPNGTLMVGCQNYTTAQLSQIFQTSVAGNGAIALAHQLIAAKLNAISILALGGTVPAQTCINNADMLLCTGCPGTLLPPLGSCSLSPGATSSLTDCLDAFNSGLAGTPHCPG